MSYKDPDWVDTPNSDRDPETRDPVPIAPCRPEVEFEIGDHQPEFTPWGHPAGRDGGPWGDG